MTGIDQKRVKVEVSGGETTLVLKTVDHHDAGLYYCFANNKEGTVKSCASLTVLGILFNELLYEQGRIVLNKFVSPCIAIRH